MEITTYNNCRLFDRLVGSILNYNAAVWGNHHSKDIQIVHCNFLRKVLQTWWVVRTPVFYKNNKTINKNQNLNENNQIDKPTNKNYLQLC